MRVPQLEIITSRCIEGVKNSYAIRERMQRGTGILVDNVQRLPREALLDPRRHFFNYAAKIHHSPEAVIIMTKAIKSILLMQSQLPSRISSDIHTTQ